MKRIVVVALGFVCLSSVAACGGKGAKGAQGDTGDEGARGDVGATGTGKDGANGVDGKQGKTGAKADEGARGEAGALSLLSFADEVAGSHCEFGGKRVNAGVDKNGDGKLQASEVTQVEYLCDDEETSPASPSLLRASNEPVGSSCVFGGTRLEIGADVDLDGVLDDAEVNAAATHFICTQQPGWQQLADLPAVDLVYSFALAAAEDASARLGFMFTDADYKQELLDSGKIADLGGPYSGPNTYVTYALDDETNAWVPYEGRSTPQTYSYSELTIADGNSYYTTSYPAFTGYVSVIKNGGAGAYALPPASIYRRMHSIAVISGTTDMFAIVAQKVAGLTLSKFPIDEFGTLANKWTDVATLDAMPTGVASPRLIDASGKLVGAYVSAANAVIRATDNPSTVTQASDFKTIGACADTFVVDIAWEGAYLYVGCLGSSGLIVKRALLDDLDAVTWEDVDLAIVGDVDGFDLEANGVGASVAVRQGKRIRVYEHLTDLVPAFDAVISGEMDLLRTQRGLVLAVCNSDTDNTLRTFLHQ